MIDSKSVDLPLLDFFAPHKILYLPSGINELALFIHADYMPVVPLGEILREFPLFLFCFELMLPSSFQSWLPGFCDLCEDYKQWE